MAAVDAPQKPYCDLCNTQRANHRQSRFCRRHLLAGTPDTAHKRDFMAAIEPEKVLTVHHWNDTLFSFTTTRGQSLRFENGHFVMIGLPVDGRPLLRAYSICSANYEEQLEFLSIKVQDGPLTSRLQHLKPGDELLVGRKPTGTLVISDVNPGRNLYLLSSGTGMAPFMSIIRDPETYERFERVILVHSVRIVSELAYHDYLLQDLPRHEFLGEMVSKQFLYYPIVTREPFKNQMRLTTAIETGKLETDLGLPRIDPKLDRAMICGSPSMLADTRAVLDALGMTISPGIGQPADYVIERAFVER
jgi:ferredoxin--NADP+ reductase